MNRGMERKTPIYGNLTITDPSGTPMFRCDRKKYDWYLTRGLAEQVDASTARLTFEPKGKGNWSDSYLMGEKNNVCVVCGEADALKLTRHHVVPYCYRSNFPAAHKNHNPYDILPVCRPCHDEYEHTHADKLKDELGRLYEAPLDGTTEAINTEESKACKHASALCRHGDRIPDERQAVMLRQIEDYLGRMPSANDLIGMSKRKVATTQVNDTHGRLVVERVGDLNAFVKLWRKHFLDAMNPRHLPPNWAVERPAAG